MSFRGLTPTLRRIAPALVVLLVAVLASLHAWTSPVNWSSPDALYYQAKTLSYRGQDEHTALHEAFESPQAAGILASERAERRENPGTAAQFTSSRWIDYSSRFFHRRILVSLIAAGIYPITGLRSVLTVSLIGYLLVALALFALLRRRFGRWLSAAVACVCILAPPLRYASFVPATDSWGLLLEICALLSATLVFDKGPRWIAAWVVALLALSITRDDSVVPLVAVGCVFLQRRERRSAILLVTGALSILPAIAIWGNASIRENLGFVFTGYSPRAEHESWGFVLSHYPSHAWHLIHSDITFGHTLGAEGILWYLFVIVALFGVFLMIKRIRGTDDYFRLFTYAILGGAIYVGLFGEFSNLRQELVLLPSAAVALALAGQYGLSLYEARFRHRSGRSSERLGVAAQT